MIIIKTDQEFEEHCRGHIEAARRVMVLTGAGISTSCGIPDFRSNDGMYRQTIKHLLTTIHDKLGTRESHDGSVLFQPSPETLFDLIPENVQARKSKELLHFSALGEQATKIALFRFVGLVREFVAQKIERPSLFHEFIGTLRDRGCLLHWYTQNIDGLEAYTGCTIYTGLPEELNMARAAGEPHSFDVIQLHGGLHTAVCEKCGQLTKCCTEVARTFLDSVEYMCPQCPETSRIGRKLPQGVLRPGLVLYDEPVQRNQQTIDDTVKWDLQRRPDLVLVAGTSLTVAGAKGLLEDVARNVRRRCGGKIVVVGKGMPPARMGKTIDYWIDMDCDHFAGLAEASLIVSGVGNAKPQLSRTDEDEDIEGLMVSLMD